MTVSIEAVFLFSLLLISACGLQEEGRDERESNPKALPFYFSRRNNESSLAKFLKGGVELTKSNLETQHIGYFGHKITYTFHPVMMETNFVIQFQKANFLFNHNYHAEVS